MLERGISHQIAAIAEPVVTLGRDGTVEYVHAGAVRLGDSLFALLAAHDQQLVGEAIAHVLREGQPVQCAVEMMIRNRRPVWHECRFVPLGHGRHEKVLLVARDISRPMDACRRIERLTEEEVAVARRLVAGRHHKQIADELDIGRRTVDRLRASILEKTGAGSLGELGRLTALAGLER